MRSMQVLILTVAATLAGLYPASAQDLLIANFAAGSGASVMRYDGVTGSFHRHFATGLSGPT